MKITPEYINALHLAAVAHAGNHGLGRACKVNPSTISRILAGITASLSDRTAERLAPEVGRFLGDWEDRPPIPVAPVYSLAGKRLGELPVVCAHAVSVLIDRDMHLLDLAKNTVAYFGDPGTVFSRRDIVSTVDAPYLIGYWHSPGFEPGPPYRRLVGFFRSTDGNPPKMGK
jgi:hypothetical protein